MTDRLPATRYRFGIFELDTATGELRRNGVRVKLHAQPFQVLVMLLERPGEMLTREEICLKLWPDGTFVDYEHGVNSAVNRLREALSDKASNPRFIETLARRGYRFLAPVFPEPASDPAPADTGVRIDPAKEAEFVPAEIENSVPPSPIAAERKPGFLDRILTSPEDLPASPPFLVRTLFLLLQAMYLGFYVGALANLTEISELLSRLSLDHLSLGRLSLGNGAFVLMIVTAVLMIPMRTFLLCGVLFHAPRMREKFLRMWPFLLVLDWLWSLAPFLLLDHINYGLALACTTLLVYSPFAQRSLILMSAGDL